MNRTTWSALAAAVVLAACGGDDRADTPPADQPAVQQPGATTPPAGGAQVQLPEGVTQQMVADGKQLFETGVCTACHGMDASGTALAPSLRDQNWLNSDGSFEGIRGVIQNGVAQPKEHPTPMPPLGGGTFNEEQVRALAAYVYSISHGG